ncbi:MAG: hypothetical protein ACAH80_02635 [Alphaproteobacteria bacterium]
MRQSQASQPPAFSLPILEVQADTLTQHFWSQFMHEFQRQRDINPEARILAAISATALRTRSTPEAVARTLVESGLCASRASFPKAFVVQIESRCLRPKWDIGAITLRQRELLDFWNRSSMSYSSTDYKPARRFH